MGKDEVVEDFLEVDDPIAGQNYVCMSFVDPEEIIQNNKIKTKILNEIN